MNTLDTRGYIDNIFILSVPETFELCHYMQYTDEAQLCTYSDIFRIQPISTAGKTYRCSGESMPTLTVES
jgi:hypothetical protein